MATYRSAYMNKENVISDAPVGTKLGAAKTALTNGDIKRSVLDNLANRAARPLHNVGLKKSSAATDAATQAAPIIDMKKVKPRVDTHWIGAVPLRSNLQRTGSQRASSKAAAAAATTAAATTEAAPRLTRTRMANTATLQTAKLTSIGATRSKSPAKATTTTTTVRRQESTLTRKSLTKLKAADAAAKPKSTGAENEAPSTVVPDAKAIARAEPVSHSQKMILQFNDVDAGDEENPLLVSEYVNDIFAYLNQLEEKYAIRKKHLEGQRDVFPKMRAVLIDWINEVHLQYRFVQETFHMAVSIIDRYLQTVPTTARQNLQLVGVTALFIASKYEELYPPEVKDFVYITDDTYTRDQVLKMERHIFKKLKFELGCPLSIHFLRRFSKVASSPGDTHLMSKYFIELTCVEYTLAHYRPSEIAAASLFISLYLAGNVTVNKVQSLDVNRIWTPELQHYSKYDGKHLQPLIRELIAVILHAPQAKLNNVYNKYASMKMSQIAVKTAKYAPLLIELSEAEL